MSLVEEAIDDFLEPARRSLQTLPRGFNGKTEAYNEAFEVENVQEQTRRVIEDLCRMSEEA